MVTAQAHRRQSLLVGQHSKIHPATTLNAPWGAHLRVPPGSAAAAVAAAAAASLVLLGAAGQPTAETLDAAAWLRLACRFIGDNAHGCRRCRAHAAGGIPADGECSTGARQSAMSDFGAQAMALLSYGRWRPLRRVRDLVWCAGPLFAQYQ